MHKRLVAGLSRLVTCLQSNFIGRNFTGFCSNLGARGLFSSPFVSYWVHIDWLAPGHPMGAGNPTISRETETQVPAACQPQPRQPHRPNETYADFLARLETAISHTVIGEETKRQLEKLLAYENANQKYKGL